MKCPSFLVSFLVLAICAPLFAQSAVAEPAPKFDGKPNFVIIFTDDQGYGDLSYYSGEHVSTPRIGPPPTPSRW